MRHRLKKLSRILLLGALIAVCAVMLFACNDPSDGQTETSEQQYTVRVSGGHIGAGSATAGNFYAGESVTVTADVPSGKHFVKWVDSDGKDISSYNPFSYTVRRCAGQNLVAVFAAGEHGASFAVSVENGYIGSQTEVIGGSYDAGAVIRLSAAIPDGKEFVCWADGNGVQLSDENPYDYTVLQSDEVQTVRAVLRDVQKTEFSVSVQGGYIGSDSSVTSGVFKKNASVTVTASVPEGKDFVCWKQNGSTVSTQPTYTFNATADVRLTAEFKNTEVYYTLTLSGASSDTAAGNVAKDASVTVTPSDALTDRHVFSHWEINGREVSRDSSYTFKMQSDSSVRAVYEDRVQIKVYTDGALTKTQFVRKGSGITVVAPAKTNKRFVGWHIGASSSVSVYDAEHTFDALNEDAELYAKYAAIAEDGKVAVDVAGGAAYARYNEATGEYSERIGSAFNASDGQVFYIKPNYELCDVYYILHSISSQKNQLDAQKGYRHQVSKAYGEISVVCAPKYSVTAVDATDADGNPIQNKVVVGGETQTFVAKETETRKFKYWRVNGAQRDDTVVSGKHTLTLTVVSDFRVEAVLDTVYTVKVFNGKIDNLTSGKFIQNTSHILVADELSGRQFKEWRINGVPIPSSKSVMAYTVGSDVEIHAIYTPVYTLSTDDSVKVWADDVVSLQSDALLAVGGSKVTVEAKNKVGFNTVGWVIVRGSDETRISVSDAGVSNTNGRYSFEYTLTADASVRAEYAQITLTVVNALGDGQSYTVKCATGDRIQLIARDELDKSYFAYWQAGGSRTENGGYVVVSQDMTVTAVFAPKTKITLIGGVFADGEYAGKAIGWFKSGSVSLRGEVPDGYRLDGWMDASGAYLVKNSLTATLSVPSQDATYTFSTVKTYTVTITNLNGPGRVTVYDEGSKVTVGALEVPDKSRFSKWIDASGNTVSQNATFDIAYIAKDYVLTAEFIRTFDFTVENLDGMGNGNAAGNYTITVDEGSSQTVTLKATSSNKRKETFAGWYVNGKQVSQSSSVTVGNILQDTVVEAKFGMLYTQTETVGYDASKSVMSSTSAYSAYNSDGSAGFVIPGLAIGQNFVMQGIASYAYGDYNWVLVCGYISPANTFAINNSVVFVVDMNQNGGGSYQGRLIKEIMLQDASGKAYTGHAGGIAATQKNLWIANGSKVHRIPMDEVKTAKSTAFLSFKESISVASKASSCSYDADDGVLWVTDFYIAGNDSYKIADADHLAQDSNKAWTVGYRINESGASGYNAQNGFKTSALQSSGVAVPDYILRTDDKVQGMTVAGSRIVLSISYGRTNNSTIKVYANPTKSAASGSYTVNGSAVSYYNLTSATATYTAQPLSEDLTTIKDASGNYYVLVATEAASNYYMNGTDGGKTTTNPIDVVWKLKIAQ